MTTHLRNTFFPACRQQHAIGWLVAYFIVVLTCGCSRQHEPCCPMEQQRDRADSIVAALPYSRDALQRAADSLAASGDRLTQLVALRELGKLHRNESRFDEALDVHNMGLKLAKEAGDTIEMVQMLNNIGTDYRRLSMLTFATASHYNALALCNLSTDTTHRARKNRVVSLNGLGNIYLSTGNYELADSAFRIALAGERQLGSALGQAINCANLASIFEKQNQTDSAWAYYRLSMQFNKQADSQLGIALCHNYFGQLYEKAGQYDRAADEYQQAAGIMAASKDEWHSLEAEIAHARICYKTGDDRQAIALLNEALATARHIKSPEHQAEIYHLFYQIDERRGDHQHALENFVKADAFRDTILNANKYSEIEKLRIKAVQQHSDERLSRAQATMEKERQLRHVGYLVFGILLLSLLIIIVLSQRSLYHRKRMQQLQRQLQQARDRFFTNITHEFRTPLTVIRSAAEQVRLMAGYLSAPQATQLTGYVDDIDRHGQSLLTLINQILDIAKLSSAQAGTSGYLSASTPEWRSGDVVAFIAMMVESYQSYAAAKHIRLVCQSEVAEQQADFIPDYLLKIVRNLVSNALKFSPAGSTVRVATAVVGDSSWQLLVADQGCGIGSEEQEHIFEPFYQANNDSHNIGTGVGLSLVKLATDAMGGTVTVESAPQQGTTFCITLPLRHGTDSWQPLSSDDYRPSAEPVPTTPRPLADTPAGEGDEATRILIVEDAPEVARYMAQQLPQGMAVYHAADGQQGLQKARQLVPDLIVTDIMMPGLSGLELCQHIRRDPLLNHIPIIMVTAMATQQDRIKGLEAGADAYMEKPFHGDELAVRIDNLLQQQRRLHDKYQAQFQTQQPAAATSAGPAIVSPPAGSVADVHAPSHAFISRIDEVVRQQLLDRGTTDIALLASTLCVTRAQLNRKVKAVTGMSTTAYLSQLRIGMACQLLRDAPELTVAQVSLRCGIEDVTYFSQLFKKLTGQTPGQYRRGEA